MQVATTSGQSVSNLNVGEFQAVAISGHVFTDQNGDGVSGGTDSGLAGWTVDLVNSSNQIVSATTASDGSFSFTGVGPGAVHGRRGAEERVRPDELTVVVQRGHQQRSSRGGAELRRFPARDGERHAL